MKGLDTAASRHLVGWFLAAPVGIILFAPQEGDVGGWLFEWLIAGSMRVGATALLLAAVVTSIAELHRL